MRPRYRLRQFWRAIRARPQKNDLDLVRKTLSPRQMGLFQNMQSAEKAHAIEVLKKLKQRGEDHPDLLVAALLHDVGKIRYPLTAWERALVVLVQASSPERARRWGRGRPKGWRRPFVVAAQHPYWGAQIAAESGVSPLVINLIWRHQEPPSSIPNTLEDRLLRTLQAADDDS